MSIEGLPWPGGISDEKDVPEQTVPCALCGGAGNVRRVDIAALKARRLAAGLSQAEVARRAGWQANVVSEMESGVRPFTRPAAERYLHALRRRLTTAEVRMQRAEEFPGEVARLAESLGISVGEFHARLERGEVYACRQEAASGCFLPNGHIGGCQSRKAEA